MRLLNTAAMRGDLTVRRARRDDFARVRLLLGIASEPTRAERKRFRRLVATLREDLYVAEREGEEPLAGLVVVAYVRGLAPPTALVRELRGEPEALTALLASAHERALARGCGRLELQHDADLPEVGPSDGWEDAGRIRRRRVMP